MAEVARRRPPGRGLPRAHQALRGGAPRARSASSPATMPRAAEPKGEIVVVVGPPGRAAAGRADALDAALARGARRAFGARRRRGGGRRARPAAPAGLCPGAGAGARVPVALTRSWLSVSPLYGWCMQHSAPAFRPRPSSRPRRRGVRRPALPCRGRPAARRPLALSRGRARPRLRAAGRDRLRRGEGPPPPRPPTRVTAAAWARIGAAASRYLAEHGDGTMPCRFDLALVDRTGRPSASRTPAPSTTGGLHSAAPALGQGCRPEPNPRARPMSLKVAVQMDPIERINIAADSTFRIMEEAQARGHRLFYYTPDRLAWTRAGSRRVAGRWRCAAGKGGHFTLGPEADPSTSPSRTWSGCARTRPSTWATSPPPTSSSASIPGHWWSTTRSGCATTPRSCWCSASPSSPRRRPSPATSPRSRPSRRGMATSS